MAKIVVLAGGDDAASATSALEGAGVDFEVVEPTAANLLHIVIGMVDDDSDKEEKEPKEKEPKEEPPAEEPPAEEEPAEEPVPESLGQVTVDGEVIKAFLGKNGTSTLYAKSIEHGARTIYTINESQFAFWPADPKTPARRVTLAHGKNITSLEVVVQESKTAESFFEVGQDIADLFIKK